MMKHLSFKIIALFLLLPPLCYIGGLHAIETQLERSYFQALERFYTGDTLLLLNGSLHLQEVVKHNIDRFMSARRAPSWGVVVQVKVTTFQDDLIYPAYFEAGDELPALNLDPLETAQANFELMRDGLILEVDVIIDHDSRLALSLMGFLLLGAMAGLYGYYRYGAGKFMREKAAQAKIVHGLSEKEKRHARQLNQLTEERARLTQQLEILNQQLLDEKALASRTEDGMIEEIVSLENKIEKNISLQLEQQEEIDTLKTQLKRLEKSRSKDIRHKGKNADALKKRFRTLYKTITIHDRAIGGYMDFSEEMKLKCEETIHLLDQDPSLVAVKRKVFNKSGDQTVFEVMFAYNGRLYYRNISDNRLEVVTVGTKNSQAKDLAFINKLPRPGHA